MIPHRGGYTEVFPCVKTDSFVAGKKGLSLSLPIANEARSAEIGLRNRAGYCIFDRIPRYVTGRGFLSG